MNIVFSRRLKQARLMRGFSMDDLSGRLGDKLSKQAIYKYEKGMMMPDSGSLIALSEALGIPVSYLFRPFFCTIDKMDFRKKAKLGVQKEAAIKERVKDRLERYIEVERLLDIKPSKPLDFRNTEIQDVEDVMPIAQQIKKDWRVGDDGINDLIELLEENSIKVIELKEEQTFDGLCGTVNGDTFVIVLNANFPIERKRFTALHELGHLVLNIPDGVERKQKERYCDAFANEMLISKSAFFKKIGENRKDISLQELIDIQRQFGISIDALMYKAFQTNVITEKRYQGYNKKKNKLSSFKEKVEESRFKDEHTGRFERLVYRALASELVSTSKASELLGISVYDVREKLMLV